MTTALEQIERIAFRKALDHARGDHRTAYCYGYLHTAITGTEQTLDELRAIARGLERARREP